MNGFARTAFASVLALAPTAAGAAAPACAGHAEILADLARKYRETVTSVAPTVDGFMIELLQSHRADGKPETWSLVKSLPAHDRACLVDAGEGWQDVPAATAPAPLVIDPNAGDPL